MNKNQIEGSLKEVTGNVQQKVGKATGNANQQVKGVAKQIEGKIQRGVGDVEHALNTANSKARWSTQRARDGPRGRLIAQWPISEGRNNRLDWEGLAGLPGMSGKTRIRWFAPGVGTVGSEVLNAAGGVGTIGGATSGAIGKPVGKEAEPFEPVTAAARFWRGRHAISRSQTAAARVYVFGRPETATSWAVIRAWVGQLPGAIHQLRVDCRAEVAFEPHARHLFLSRRMTSLDQFWHPVPQNKE